MPVRSHSISTGAFVTTSLCVCSSQGSRNYKWKQLLILSSSSSFYFTTDTSLWRQGLSDTFKKNTRWIHAGFHLFVHSITTVPLVVSSRRASKEELRVSHPTTVMMPWPGSHELFKLVFLFFPCFEQGFYHTRPSMFFMLVPVHVSFCSLWGFYALIFLI